MANCPKCGTHLSPMNWKPNCTKCGVNILYYDMDARLAADADRAEAEAARFSAWGGRIKSVTVGSRIALLRLLSFLLPILAALLPFARARLMGLGISEEGGVSLITVIKGLMKGAGVMGFYLNFSNDGKILFGALLILITVVCALGGLIASVFSYGKGGRITMISFLAAGLAASVLAEVLLLLGGGAPGVGFFLSAACFVLCLVLSRFVSKKTETE